MTTGHAAHRAQNAACLHCGLPARKDYCCSGCFLAHRLSPIATGDADAVSDGDASSRGLLARIVLSAFLATGVMVFSLALYAPWLEWGSASTWDGDAAQAIQGLSRLAALALSAPVLYLIGVPLLEAVVHLRRWLSADSLVLAGTLSAFGVSVWNTFRGSGHVYFETATLVLVLVGLGRWMDVRARERARRAVEERLPERVRDVTRVDEHADRLVAPEALSVGDRVRVLPGETLAVDGTVLEGRSFLDTADLTGEEEPQSAGPGDSVLAGTRLIDGTLVVRATAVDGARVRDEIERCLAEALDRRPRSVRLADRCASWLLPLALAVALGSTILRWSSVGPEKALLDALCVVLIACPCALGIATPLAFWVALEEAWKRGVLVRGGDVLERLARVRRAFLDKTGTLTHAELEVTEIVPYSGFREDDALRAATALEIGSEHPIGRAIRAVWDEQHAGCAPPPIKDFQALPGIGVEARLFDAELQRDVSWRLARVVANGQPPSPGPLNEATTTTTLLRESEPVAEFRLRAQPRAEARSVVHDLAALNLRPTVLTGDGRRPAEALARSLGLEVHAELLPADKVRFVSEEPGALFVGDGLNDAAALAAAEVGVSVATSSARSLDAAHVNLLRPGLDELPPLISLARAAVRTARINLAWAVTYNVVGVALAATGNLTPIFAAAAMVGSSAAVVLHSSRLARRSAVRPPSPRPETSQPFELAPTGAPCP